ncbi:hypothetical protein JCM5353_002981 [Sporobolomyces roseus]
MQVDPTPLSSTASRPPPPKGILKNSSSSSQGQSTSPHSGLAWDEANLSLNEVQKDSTMKITEPKTPYVRYNAETDEVMDLDKIPGFELGITSLNSPPTAPHTSDSTSSRRGSEGSEKMVRVERTNSFNSQMSGEPSEEAMRGMSLQSPEEVEDSDDEPADEETKEHRKQFAQKRDRHYSNEAEAMKRAQALMEREDDEDDERAIDDEEEEDSYPGTLNGSNSTSTSNGVPPPVPSIPTKFTGSNGI